MNWVIYFFGSGTAFFGGVTLVMVAVALVACCQGKWLASMATLAAVLGLLFIFLSATPLPYWFYAVARAGTMVWLGCERWSSKLLSDRRLWLRLAVVGLWGGAAAMEIPFHLVPIIGAPPLPALYILGDSVAAGMNETRKDTWPALLAAQHHNIEVHDHSQMGAKVRTMLRKTESLTLGDGLILLEIGGNDLLSSTSAGEFERNLDELLSRLCGPTRVVVMFELPLPPLANEFGRAQRRLAAKYQVHLIPKRIFVAVLTAEGATVDGIHLSPQGHQLMAETVWGLLRKAFRHRLYTKAQ